jgi:hypothetical protein
MKLFSIFCAVLLSTISVRAQKVTVTTQSEKVKSESAEGYSTELEGKKATVNNSWIKFLKEIGKVRQSADPVTITEPVFNGLSFPKGTIYSITREKGENTYVWLGFKPTEWEAANVKRIQNELEKAVHQFGVSFYHDKIQIQIDEAQQALDAVEKQKQRIANQTKDLTLQMANNEQEKFQLDKTLEVNKLENAVLKVKLTNNTKAQDSLAQAGNQILKVKETQIERQRKVN